MVANRSLSSLPAREVHERLRKALAELQRAERNAVLWFAEIVRRKLYRELGYSSIHQYAELELGFGMTKTSQFLRLSESLKRLPRLRRSLARGEIAWTAAREVAMVATPNTEKAWITQAKQIPRRELEQRVAETRRQARAGTSGKAQSTLEMGAPVSAADSGSGSTSHDDAGNVAEVRVDPATPVNVSLRMTAEQYARYQALLEALRKQKAGTDAVDLVLAALEEAAVGDASNDSPREMSEAKAQTVTSEGDSTAHFPRGKSEPRPGVGSGAGNSSELPRGKYRRSPYQVVVQKCPSCNGATIPTNRGERVLSPVELRTILCDSRVLAPGKRNKTPIPERVRRAVMQRDRFRCRAGGCGRTSFLAVHHLAPREAGGTNTLENLITLCSGCHRSLHARE